MKRSIHVVHIITKLELGGAQKVCLTLVNELKKRGINTFLVSGKEGLLVRWAQEHTQLILLDELYREIGGIRREIICFFKLCSTLHQLRKKHPNLIVHTHSTKAGLLGRWAAFCAGAKHRIHTIHGYGFNNYQPLLIRYGIILCEWITSLITTHFICVSSEDVKEGIKLFPGFINRHSIIRAAIDYTKFYQPNRTIADFSHNRPFVIGTISCFKKQKNLFDLLHAFKWAYVQDNTLRLEIIGDGALRNDILDWINQYRLNEVITLHGWQHDVLPFMINWHCFVLTSLWEGLPCSVIEARCLKLPVISYNTGGIPDIIMHEKNGLLCSQRDWLGLAQNIYTLKKQPAVYNALSNYKDNLDDFTSQAMVEQHVQLYTTLSKRRSGTRELTR